MCVLSFWSLYKWDSHFLKVKILSPPNSVPIPEKTINTKFNSFRQLCSNLKMPRNLK